MPPRIAIPLPHSTDLAYSERALPQYERAVREAGGAPIRIPLDQNAAQLKNLIATCDAVLLPGSNADIDPKKFAAGRSPKTAAADPKRDDVDNQLLADAYKNRKPILGICYGLQSLNVFRNGSLIQHIPDFLPENLRAKVNHEAGKTVPIAHSVEISPSSRLAEIVGTGSSKAPLPVNSSHHQSADNIGDGLHISARCTEDGIIEAIEGTDPNHFVIAVQWHPERSIDLDAPSGALFQALVEAANIRR
jgi:putative glutamine amidotransferase